MTDSLLPGIALAILASIHLNVGKGIQKWKVRVLAAGRGVLSPAHRRDFALWLFGVGLTTSATVLFSLALKFTDRPSMVSALNGTGIIALVLFAAVVLGERIGPAEIAGALAVAIGTVVMGLNEQGGPPVGDYSLPRLVGVALVLVAPFVALAAVARRRAALHGIAYGGMAGALIGVSLVLGDLALVRAGGDFFAQLTNPYPYVAVAIGSVALALTQVAFWRATAITVVPTTNAFIILAPVVLERAVFDSTLVRAQYAAVATIVLGVVLLTAVKRDPSVLA